MERFACLRKILLHNNLGTESQDQCLGECMVGDDFDHDGDRYPQVATVL